MCLEVLAQIDPSAPARISARRLKRLTGLAVRGTRLDDQPALHLSVSGFCSCELLTHGSEPGKETLDLDAGHRTKHLERREKRVTTAEMIALVEANAVGNKVLYEVREPA